jgi:adenylate cyclase
MIWSFTLQYHQPAALYLKAPTLLYIFILIALRALRYDPGHVALTGLMAAAGWLMLTCIAAVGGAPQTDDYLRYLSSLSLFWGAEFEKIAAIVATTAVLALAVSRARTLLIRTAIEESAATELSRFLDPSAASRVRGATTALEAGHGRLVHATIMFLDLRGFSDAAAKLPPPAVIALLNDYQSRFVPIVEAAGGGVDKYLGDGILVSFGTSRDTQTEGAEAFAAIPALIAAADAWRAERDKLSLPRLEVAIAIASGDVIHGVVGTNDRLEYTVVGDAVNLAAKLEKHAKVERARVIATKSAFDRAHAQGDATPVKRAVTNAAVEGVGKPIDLVVLA